MAAQLFSGIRCVQLLLDTPTDQATGRVRDDLSAVKVWYSTTNNFDVDTQGILAFNGLSLSITIPDLDAATTYYVKYAFISAIDSSVYTLHTQLSATVLEDSPPLDQLVGTINHAQYKDTFFIINIDGVDVDVELRFDRTTGGPASLTWNGQYIQCSRPFISQELGINNISATEPATPFAKQVWLHVT
jgi:hypothetical protein